MENSVKVDKKYYELRVNGMRIGWRWPPVKGEYPHYLSDLAHVRILFKGFTWMLT